MDFPNFFARQLFGQLFVVLVFTGTGPKCTIIEHCSDMESIHFQITLHIRISMYTRLGLNLWSPYDITYACGLNKLQNKVWTRGGNFCFNIEDSHLAWDSGQLLRQVVQLELRKAPIQNPKNCISKPRRHKVCATLWFKLESFSDARVRELKDGSFTSNIAFQPSRLAR